MKDFKELQIWQRSHRLTLQIYRVTEHFPREELYGLTSQMRRACSSIPTNIAEGCGRDGDAELARFFQIAMGSASEFEYQLLLARDLELLSVTDYDVLVTELVEIKKMLNAFIQKLRANR
jgi:four helix bundle protein